MAGLLYKMYLLVRREFGCHERNKDTMFHCLDCERRSAAWTTSSERNIRMFVLMYYIIIIHVH